MLVKSNIFNIGVNERDGNLLGWYRSVNCTCNSILWEGLLILAGISLFKKGNFLRNKMSGKKFANRSADASVF